MCGIFFSCTNQQVKKSPDLNFDYLRRRGPDSFKIIHRQVEAKRPDSAAEADSCISYLIFVATVLSLRGDHIVEQPLEDAQSGSILCWNGEAWKIGDTTVLDNDSVAIMSLLSKAAQSHSVTDLKDASSEEVASQAILEVMGSISGPYAFVFYDAQNQRMFYGRDALGRRSLLQKIDTDGGLSLSSICQSSKADEWTEVEAGYIYMLDLASGADAPYNLDKAKSSINISSHTQITGRLKKIQFSKASFPELNKKTLKPALPAPNIRSATTNELFQHLQASLSLRVQNVPCPPLERNAPSRLAILFSGGLDCTLLARVIHGILPLEYDIDLLNVAFENPRVVKAANALNPGSSLSDSAYSLCPDRRTGISSYAELLQVCPGRMWRLVSIDIPYSETLSHRPNITRLIHPHNTEMDLSIACALYFAARGSGTVSDQTTGSESPYTTTARVLLSGLGADEVFAGYKRHATAFDRKGYSGLVDELELDFKRLGKRNLGRDDRVISYWGREARYPYLDEDLVTWALKLPVWEKCGFGHLHPAEDKDINQHPSPDLEPGKQALRLLAWNLGMRGVAMEKKRAIQFGARTAKMEAGRTKGTQALT